MTPIVISVSRARAHRFSKISEPFIALIQDHGVEGDAHAGSTVQHRFHKAKDPTQPNLCQVHLIQAELHDELNAADFDISPGGMGENILTRGIDLFGLSTGTRYTSALTPSWKLLVSATPVLNSIAIDLGYSRPV